jgi:hypothetical protein
MKSRNDGSLHYFLRLPVSLSAPYTQASSARIHKHIVRVMVKYLAMTTDKLKCAYYLAGTIARASTWTTGHDTCRPPRSNGSVEPEWWTAEVTFPLRYVVRTSLSRGWHSCFMFEKSRVKIQPGDWIFWQVILVFFRYFKTILSYMSNLKCGRLASFRVSPFHILRPFYHSTV